MSARLKSLLLQLFAPTLLSILVAVIAWVNFSPGTYLSGWDTLHPEFNLSLYAERAWSGAWMEHQGLGAPPSQAHAAELVRLPLVWFLMQVLPLNAVRYGFMFLMLWLGVVGMHQWSSWLAKSYRASVLVSKLAGLIGAIFYLCNLVTVQQFFVPLEMFAIHFAALPWLFLFGCKYLTNHHSTKDLLWFGLTTLLAAPMAHTPTLWFAYLGFLIIFLLTYWVSKRSTLVLKKIGILFGLSLIINLFWLLPSVYYIATHAEVVRESTIHQIFSDEAYLQGKAFGKLSDLAQFKNFLFNWLAYDAQTQEFTPLMQEWSHWLEKFEVQVIIFSLFGWGILGAIIAVRRRQTVVLSLMPALFIALTLWLTATPPFEWIVSLLRQHNELFREGLRFAFTKISIFIVFGWGTFITIASLWLLEKLKRTSIQFTAVWVLALAIMWSMLPMFRGNLISEHMKVNIPEAYFEMFEWFASQPLEARVAKLPVLSLWGWEFHDWDYQGAGFTWFGIPQPTLDREFDRWGKWNEGFYLKIKQAVYANDLELLKSVLNQYQVQFLLLDESVINAGGNSDLLYFTQLKKMLGNGDFNQTFQKDFLSVYSYQPVANHFIPVIHDSAYSQNVPNFVMHGNAIETLDAPVIPFASLDMRSGINLSTHQGTINVSTKIEPKLFRLNLPSMATANELKYQLSGQWIESEKQMKLQFQPLIPIVEVESKQYSNTFMTERYSLSLDVKPDYIAVNETIFQIPGNARDDAKLGTTILPLGSPISLQFFSKQNEVIWDDGLNQWNNYYWQDCLDRDFGLGESANVVVTEKSACLGAGASFASPVLVDYRIEYKTRGVGLVVNCFAYEGETECRNINEHSQRLITDEYINQGKFLAEPGKSWLDIMVKKISGDEFSAHITDTKASFIPAYDIATIDLDSLSPENWKSESLQLSMPIDELTIAMPAEKTFDEQFENSAETVIGRNCDVLKRGWSKKELILGSAVYSSGENGIACDSWPMSTRPNTSSYVLRVKGENITGRSLKVYIVNNLTGLVEKEWLLPNGQFDQLTPIIATSNPTQGLSINIESRSFGSVLSHNVVDLIELYAIDFEWLSSILLTTSEPNSLEYNLLEVNFPHDTQNRFISNWQGFDAGWLGYEIDGVKCGAVCRLMPWWFGERLEHVKVNGWANGYLVNRDQGLATSGDVDTLASNRQPLTTIAIVFWPQYLEWLGFVALGLTFVCLGLKIVKNRK